MISKCANAFPKHTDIGSAQTFQEVHRQGITASSPGGKNTFTEWDIYH